MRPKECHREPARPVITLDDMKLRLFDDISFLKGRAPRVVAARLRHIETRLNMVLNDRVAAKEISGICEEINFVSRAIVRRLKLKIAFFTLAGATLILLDGLLWKLQGRSPWFALINCIIALALGPWIDSIITGLKKASTKHCIQCPPPLAEFILLLIPMRDREHLIGDLEEEFRVIVLPKHGLFKANLYYWWQVIISLFPYILRFFKRALGVAVFFKLIGK